MGKSIIIIVKKCGKRNKMQQSLLGGRAKVVGYLDIVFTIICEIAVLFEATAMEEYRLNLASSDRGTAGTLSSPDKLLQVASCLYVFLGTLFTCAQLEAAVHLIAATKPGCDPRHAWNLTTYWTAITIGFLVLPLIPALILGSLNTFMVNAIVRTAFLGVVDMFRLQLI